MDLSEFLAARLDEDERAAPMAGARAWRTGFGEGRLLRQVEAGRKILAVHNLAEHYCPLPVVPGRHGQLWTPDEGPCWTLRLLAAVYSDHPNYREEWAVTATPARSR